MTKRNQGINVKVSRVKVIKALERSLVKLDTDYKNQEVNEAKYRTAHKNWLKTVSKIAISKIAKAENIQARVNYSGRINIDFDLPAGVIKLPKEPEREFETMQDWQYKDSKEEIENAIRVLKMCDDELINTATYGGITKYL